MKSRIPLALLSSIVLFSVSPSIAHADPFDVTLSSNGDTRSFSFTDVQDAVDTFSNTSLSKLLPGYATGSAATGTVNLRGLNATLSYPAGSNTLTLNIPSIGLTRSFTGTDRNESQDMLRDFFKGENGNNLLTEILQKLASGTPIDPVAGNPNALLSRMGDADFARGTDSREGFNLSSNETPSNSFDTEIGGGRFHTDVANQTTASADLTYRHALPDENVQLLFDLPAEYTDDSGAKAYDASFGVGARVPILQNWALTPIVRVGGAGSVDLGSAAIIYDGSVTSDFRIPLDKQNEFQVGDLIGYDKTNGITVGNYHVDYDLSNLRTKNGVAFSHSFESSPVSAKIYFNDSRFFGSSLYDEGYDEAGAAVATKLGKFTSLQFGAEYVFAHGYNGPEVNLALKF